MPRTAKAWALAGALLAGALLGCGGDEDEAPSSATEAAAGAGCADVEAPPPKDVKLSRPKSLAPPPEGTPAVVDTSCGTFEIELAVAEAPKTTASFAYMVEQGLYDDTSIHRIVPGFVIQGGDPKGDGTGGPGYFVDEPPPQGLSYTEGTVAMAKTSAEPPGRSGSQFYVVTAPDAGLPPDYALLGELSGGEEVIDEIEKLGDPAAGQTGTPARPVVIERITLGEP